MNEHSRAEQQQTEITALLDEAQQLLVRHVALLARALDDAEHLVSQAQNLAKQFNRTEARAWVLTESCGVTFAKVGPLDVRRLLQNMADLKMTPCEVASGVRVRLGMHVTYHDVAPGTVLAMSLREAERLAREGSASRVEEPATYEPTPEQ